MRYDIQKYWTRGRKLLKNNVSSIFSWWWTTDIRIFLAYYWLKPRSRRTTVSFTWSLRIIWGHPRHLPSLLPQGKVLLATVNTHQAEFSDTGAEVILQCSTYLASVLQADGSAASQSTCISWSLDTASLDLGQLPIFSALAIFSRLILDLALDLCCGPGPDFQFCIPLNTGILSGNV